MFGFIGEMIVGLNEILNVGFELVMMYYVNILLNDKYIGIGRSFNL